MKGMLPARSAHCHPRGPSSTPVYPSAVCCGSVWHRALTDQAWGPLPFPAASFIVGEGNAWSCTPRPSAGCSAAICHYSGLSRGPRGSCTEHPLQTASLNSDKKCLAEEITHFASAQPPFTSLLCCAFLVFYRKARSVTMAVCNVKHDKMKQEMKSMCGTVGRRRNDTDDDKMVHEWR